jgi:large subunit ribosomal protein L23
MRAIILKPLINEKSMMLAKGEFYTFLIDLDATKDQVAKIIREKFGVKVLSVRTVTLPGKSKNQRTRKGKFMTAKTKKAIVQVGKGQRIALFEEATKEPEEEVEVRTAEGESMGTVKEKKSLLSGTKVKIEKNTEELAGNKARVEKQETMNQAQSGKTSSKESK